jgi:hypothetical protein
LPIRHRAITDHQKIQNQDSFFLRNSIC